MTLEEHIDDIRNRLRNGEFIDEEAVSGGIVKRLLHALDWNIFDVQVVVSQYTVDSGRVDFALCPPRLTPQIFIEVKRIGLIDTSAENQLLRYAFNQGVPVLILTDGREWHFAYTSGTGPFIERTVCTIDLEEMDSQECAELFRKYLRYESVSNRELRQAIEAAYRNVERQRKMEEILPEAWAALVEEADELLRDVVAEKVKELCGDEPSADQVLDFLKSLESGETSESLITRAQRVSSDASESTSSGSGRRPPTRLKVKINGETIAERTGTDTYVKVIERLGVERIYNLGIDWIVTSQPERTFRQFGKYYVRMEGDTKTLKRRLDNAASMLGVQLTIKIVPK